MSRRATSRTGVVSRTGRHAAVGAARAGASRAGMQSGARRILFCPPLYPPSLGGSQALFADLVRLWQAAGGEAVVYTTRPDPVLAPVARDLPPGGGPSVRRFPARCLAASPWQGRALGALSRVGPRRWRAAVGFPHVLSRGYRPFLRRRAALRDGPFRAVVGGVLPHVHFLEPAARLAARLRIPLVVIPLVHVALLERHGRRRVLGAGARSLLAAAWRVIAMTEAEVEPLHRLGVAPDRIRVLPAALDGDEPIPEPSPEAGRSPGPVVLQAGALAGDKGTLVLLAAWERLATAAAPARLLLAGRPAPEVRAALRRLRPEVAATVRLELEPSRVAWDRALAGASILAHPTAADSFGRVVLEAWRVSVPPVVAAAGGPGRLVRHGRDGLVVPEGDPAVLAAALADLLADGDRRRALGAAGARRFRREFTWATVFPRWQAVLDEAAGAPAGGEGAP